jgi:hypothetical protein
MGNTPLLRHRILRRGSRRERDVERVRGFALHEPGLLVIYLIARREWRAVAWTTGFGLVLIAATIVDVGAGAHAAFMTHLPGLLSGEAFPAFRNPGWIRADWRSRTSPPWPRRSR